MISIEINLLSIHLNLHSIDYPFKSKNKSPEKFLCTIGYHKIIEDLGHSWGTPLNNCLGLGAVFLDLIRHIIVWEPLRFKALT